jgi:hypothetical protein
MDDKQLSNEDMLYECAITTNDNPYDPFEQFTLWDLFDKEKGYYSNQKVARLANFTDDMTELEVCEENERAIDRLIAIDFTNSFKKVKRQVNYN